MPDTNRKPRQTRQPDKDIFSDVDFVRQNPMLVKDADKSEFEEAEEYKTDIIFQQCSHISQYGCISQQLIDKYISLKTNICAMSPPMAEGRALYHRRTQGPQNKPGNIDSRSRRRFYMNKPGSSAASAFMMDVYGLMKNNPDLVGTFRLIDYDMIEWQLNDEFRVHIWPDQINIGRLRRRKNPIPLTHWHPDEDELYDSICTLGTRGNVTVIRKSWLCDALLYSGPLKNCSCTRKWFFGKYYYLYAK